jgi:catechol 2,3-dioxygenase-like lactoylglutathione lyase family enzyme
MTTNQSLISPVQSLVIRVTDLEAARTFYETTLGLTCVGETDEIAPSTRMLWGMATGTLRAARFAKPEEPFGMIDLVQWSDGNQEPKRTAAQTFAPGIFTLNFRVGDFDRAIAQLQPAGAEPISEPLEYEAGNRIREAMVTTPLGERATILQVGDATTTPHPLGEAVATVGSIVPDLQRTIAFYRDALRLKLALTIDQQGEPFCSLLGAPPETRLQFALLTSGTGWVGKFEFMQLTLPQANDAVTRNDGRHTGYWMMSVLTEDIHELRQVAEPAGAQIIAAPRQVERPFVGPAQAMILRAPGGELLECLQPK